MTLVQDRGRPRRERPSVTPFVALFIAPSVAFPEFSSPLESDDELFNQPAGLSGAKPLVNAPPTALSVPKYSEDDLQRILKTVLEARAPAPTPAPAFIVSEVPQEKLKARSPDVYCGNFLMDCDNFCQQCEDYLAIAGATGPAQISFVAFFFWDWISFR